MGEKHRPAEVENKTVIIVDDGIATGNTILAAIKMMRKKKPRKIIVAVPVAPPETLKKLRNHVDDLICLHSPADFFGVGQFYIDFSEISDEEVSGLLKEINHYGAAA
jgi:putative phosphoribosyl transferase